MLFNLKLVLLLSGLIAVSHATGLIVLSSLGKIKGSLMHTRLNKTIFAFRGIRYGKSTAGERRFKVFILRKYLNR